MASINSILTKVGKGIGPGETITFTLVKGPSTISSDAISTTDTRTPALQFPRMAKFIDTVIRPDFTQRFHNGRLYEENVPTAKDDDDSDNEGSDMPDVLKDEEENVIPRANRLKKKKRWRRNVPPRRHWVLCEEEEYQRKLRTPKNEFPKGTSHRYEGVPEYNTSNYVLLSLHNTNPFQINVQTIHGFHSFSQPARMENVTLQQVEQQMTNQRATFKKQLIQSKRASSSTTAAAAAAATAGNHNPHHKSTTKLRNARLFHKLHAADHDDDNDIMADLSFRNKSSMQGMKAREELLTDMADEDVYVDGNGVLGGANDGEFGGGGRFGSFRGSSSSSAAAAAKSNAAQTAKKKAMTEHGASAANTLDGSAMAADFYTRDVSAEYEDLDYDPNEQFDDDDQDMGQGEISLMDPGGFVGDGSGDEDEDGEDDGGDQNSTGGGLATKAGYMAFMAKARGEGGEDTTTGGNTIVIPGVNGMPAFPKKMDGNGPLLLPKTSEKDSINHHAKKNSNLPNKSNPKTTIVDSQNMTRPLSPNATNSAIQPPRKKTKQFNTKDAGVALDASGQRLITIDTVRKEIWLHNQQISLKKLGKIFGVSSKSKDRVSAFKACLKELCTVVDDPVEGQKICRLKQHYSNMGAGA